MKKLIPILLLLLVLSGCSKPEYEPEKEFELEMDYGTTATFNTDEYLPGCPNIQMDAKDGYEVAVYEELISVAKNDQQIATLDFIDKEGREQDIQEAFEIYDKKVNAEDDETYSYRTKHTLITVMPIGQGYYVRAHIRDKSEKGLLDHMTFTIK